MKGKKIKKATTDYFDDGIRAIKNMMKSGIGRPARRGLSRRLLGKGQKGWKDYVEAEKAIRAGEL